MVGVQESALTIAVSNAGGLGSLPCVMLLPDVLRAELKFIKSQTGKPFNLNFFCHTAPDAIIVRGLEVGGHRGIFLNNDLSSQVATYELLKQIVEISKLPVIADGVISTANDVAKTLSLGASAVQIGTANLLCPETKTSQIQRAAIKSKKT